MGKKEERYELTFKGLLTTLCGQHPDVMVNGIELFLLKRKYNAIVLTKRDGFIFTKVEKVK